ncbi:MAG: hypothetical protein M1831_000545 [Alyxoria varia]|nr:MAG: hypothetical protein M1831_000545 [Alyxoria varia]
MAPKPRPKNKQPPWSHRSRLSAYVGFDSLNDLEEWLRDEKLFQRDFLEMYNDLIKPAQDKAGSKRVRFSDLDAVEKRIAEGSRGQNVILDTRDPEKDQFVDTDHIALWLIRARDSNERRSGGIFYGKSFSEREQNEVLWQVYLKMTYDLTPSKIDNAKGGHSWGSIMMGLRQPKGRGAQKKPAQLKGSSGSKTQPPSAKHAAKAPVPSAASASAKSPTSGNDAPHDEETTDAEPSDEELEHRPDVRPREAVDKKQQQHNLELLVRECGMTLGSGHKFDKTDFNLSIWRYGFLQRFTEERSKETIGRHEDFGIAFADRMANNTEFLDLFSPGADLQPITQQDDELSAETYNNFQKLFDNPTYQRENHDEACRNLFIRNPKIPKLPLMLRSTQLKFFQPVAIDGINKFQESGIGGAILGDKMGLGKTIETIGLYLHKVELAIRSGKPLKPMLIVTLPSLIDQWVSEGLNIITDRCEVRVLYGDARAKAKTKARGELERDDPLLQPRVITSDTKSKAVVVVTSYQTLTSRHGPTHLARHLHENQGYQKKTVQKLIESPEFRPTPKHEWPHDLSRMFSLAVLDEGHYVKDPDTQASKTLAWIDADFYVFATASPVINTITDFRGFLKFIRYPEEVVEEVKSALKKAHAPKDIDPYKQQTFKPRDGNPIDLTPLMFDAAYFKRFVLNDKFADDRPRDISQGVSLAKIYERCLIRRTYHSRIPFDAKDPTSRQVGEDMPTVSPHDIHVTLPEDQKKEWDAFQQSMKNIIVPKKAKPKDGKTKKGPKGKQAEPQDPNEMDLDPPAEDANRRYTIDPQNYRKSVLWECWSGLAEIESIIKASHIARFRTRENALWHLIREVFKQRRKAKKLSDVDSEIPPKNDIAGQIRLYRGADNVACTSDLFDEPSSIPVKEQAIGRIVRIGQRFNVKVFEYWLEGTFNQRRILTNWRKQVPGLVAELDRVLFGPRSGGEGINEGAIQDEDADVIMGDENDEQDERYETQGCSLGKWVEYKGALYRADDSRVANKQLSLLHDDQVVTVLQRLGRGKVVNTT